ncbi:hypothetical protein OFM21_31720, partial [Escherichia coli]|nr:hypothetical protein [Escherichia coli]
IFSSYKEKVLPWFEQLLPLIVNLICRHRPWADRQWGLCIFDDIIEHCSPAGQVKSQDEDYDEQVEEPLQDEDDNDVYILTKVSD